MMLSTLCNAFKLYFLFHCVGSLLSLFNSMSVSSLKRFACGCVNRTTRTQMGIPKSKIENYHLDAFRCQLLRQNCSVDRCSLLHCPIKFSTSRAILRLMALTKSFLFEEIWRRIATFLLLFNIINIKFWLVFYYYISFYLLDRIEEVDSIRFLT